MQFKNYVPLKKLSLRYHYFCFIDVKEYLADALFVKNKVQVWFGKEYAKEGSVYNVLFCKVKKKDTERFLKTMEELKNKMLLLGYTDYDSQCIEFFEKMLAH